MRIKILSLWQPHATLCVIPSKHNPEVPAKPVETRGWALKEPGWYGWHSAKKKDPLYKQLCNDAFFKKYIPDFEKLPFGYIVGMVYISNCHPTDSLALNSFIEMISDEDMSRMEEIREFGNFEPGRYGYTITDFVQFTEPIKQSGSQGLWYHEMPNHINERVYNHVFKLWGTILDYAKRDFGDPCASYLFKPEDNEEKSWIYEDSFDFSSSITN